MIPIARADLRRMLRRRGLILTGFLAPTVVALAIVVILAVLHITNPAEHPVAGGEDLPAFELRGGGRGVHVGGRFLTSTRVVAQPSGGFRVVCGEDHNHDLDQPMEPGGVLETVTTEQEAPKS